MDGRRQYGDDGQRRLNRASFSLGQIRHHKFNTNSAELIAADHATSFSLALISELGKAALVGGEILLTASVRLELTAAEWTMTNLHLNVVARLPRLSQEAFIDATLRAKMKCPVSRALRPAVSMNAKLESIPQQRTRQLLLRNIPVSTFSDLKPLKKKTGAKVTSLRKKAR